MEIIITPQSKKHTSLIELWEFRELLFFLAWRDIKVRYKQTIIGIFWAVLQPFLTMIVFTFFFNKVIGVSSGNIPYPLFIFSGLLLWNYFSTSLQDVSNSLIANQSIITKVYFPRIIVLIVATIVPIVDFFFAFLFFIILFVFFHITFSFLALLSIVPALIFSMITAVGLGSFLAILNVKYRDVRYALPFFIQLLLFVTPVIYSIRQVPSAFKLFFYLNPLTGIIDLIRVTMLHEHNMNGAGLVISGISSVIFFVIGLIFFSRYERSIADAL